MKSRARTICRRKMCRTPQLPLDTVPTIQFEYFRAQLYWRCEADSDWQKRPSGCNVHGQAAVGCTGSLKWRYVTPEPRERSTSRICDSLSDTPYILVLRGVYVTGADVTLGEICEIARHRHFPKFIGFACFPHQLPRVSTHNGMHSGVVVRASACLAASLLSRHPRAVHRKTPPISQAQSLHLPRGQ